MYITAARENSEAGHRFYRKPEFPFWTLAMNRKGSFSIECEDEAPAHFGPETIRLTEPNTPYKALYETDITEGIWALFIPAVELLPLLNWPEKIPGWRVLNVTNKALWNLMYQSMELLVDGMTMEYAERDTLAMNALEHVLLLGQSAMRKGTYGLPHDPRIQKIVEAILKNAWHNWSLAELSQMVNMSVPNLMRQFVKEVGTSPIRYAEIQKIEHAKALLLQSNLSVGDIAERLGYANPFHFSRSFRKDVGKSPREFRNAPSQGLDVPQD
ncbi:MAG: AraC family transcriptional regulator [Chthoniobacterales bacterium]